MTFLQAATIETIHKIQNNVARLQKFDMRLYEKVIEPKKKFKKIKHDKTHYMPIYW